jgi:hypothetical protein
MATEKHSLLYSRVSFTFSVDCRALTFISYVVYGQKPPASRDEAESNVMKVSAQP